MIKSALKSESIANVSQRSVRGLPQALRAAQDAMHLPEVQDMLRRLSDYKLGIFMPHMHDDETGDFQLLPDDVIQVEAGLHISFQSVHEMDNQTDRFLPVRWVWQDSATTPSAVCEMVWDDGQGDTQCNGKHTMIK